MPRIEFTRQLAKHVDCPPMELKAGTLDAAFAEAFAAHPQLGGYVLDDQGRIRKHVAVFVDNELLRQREDLQSIALHPDSQIFVMQALSGG